MDMPIFRRLRGALGVALTWGTAFSTLATTLLLSGLAVGFIPSAVFGPKEIVQVVIRTFLAGGLAGTLFASVLAGAERRRTLGTLSLKRVAVWGFLGAACIPGVFAIALGLTGAVSGGLLLSGTALYGAIGSVLSTATVRMAQRIPASTEPHA